MHGDSLRTPRTGSETYQSMSDERSKSPQLLAIGICCFDLTVASDDDRARRRTTDATGVSDRMHTALALARMLPKT